MYGSTAIWSNRMKASATGFRKAVSSPKKIPSEIPETNEIRIQLDRLRRGRVRVEFAKLRPGWRGCDGTPFGSPAPRSNPARPRVGGSLSERA